MARKSLHTPTQHAERLLLRPFADTYVNEEDGAERDQGKVLPGDEGLVLQEEPPR